MTMWPRRVDERGVAMLATICISSCLLYINVWKLKKSSSISTKYIPNREYWMIYIRPGFLVIVWFGSSLTPLSPPLASASCLSSSVFQLTVGRGGGGGVWGAKAYDRERSLVLYKSFHSLWYPAFLQCILGLAVIEKPQLRTLTKFNIFWHWQTKFKKIFLQLCKLSQLPLHFASFFRTSEFSFFYTSKSKYSYLETKWE